MLSKTSLHVSSSLQGGFKSVFYTSTRCVHWYHTAKAAGAPNDEYELFNRQREFGQGEIGDKERYPHLYWNLWKNRTVLQRVVQQWGYSKDFKPEQLRRDAEKLAYFMKLDDLDFLEETRPEYSFVDDDANNAVGYITDDEDDEIQNHSDYGKLYSNASGEYRSLVLNDHCIGRPVYEWQIPYGMDSVYKYKSISSAVDILNNENKLNNINCNYKLHHNQSTISNSILLLNDNTQQEILLCTESITSGAIKTWSPDTVVIQCGAEKLLSQMKGFLSPTNRTDVYGCAISLTWSLLFYLSPIWPTNLLLSSITMATLAAINGTFLFRTFLHPKDQLLKGIFSSVRKNHCDLVLGDWLLDDYDERLHQVSEYDELNNNMYNTDGSSLDSYTKQQAIINKQPQQQQADSLLQLIKNIGIGTNLYDKNLTPLSLDDVSSSSWMNTYRDAINNRRIDLLSHVLNNCEGDKILMSVSNIDNLSDEIVMKLIKRRLCGDIKIGKSVFKYDNYYERVQVDMNL